MTLYLELVGEFFGLLIVVVIISLWLSWLMSARWPRVRKRKPKH